MMLPDAPRVVSNSKSCDAILGPDMQVLMPISQEKLAPEPCWDEYRHVLRV